LALAALFCGLPCCGCPLYQFSAPPILEWWNRVPFDSEAWKATDNPEARYHMAWDLVHRDILKGKTPDEVKVLIGSPMTKDVFDHPMMPKFETPHFKRGVETWYYTLGSDLYDKGFGPSGAVLCVDFENGKVFDVRKVSH
jgi:hypothetical protein